jgi:hypothetical protein
MKALLTLALTAGVLAGVCVAPKAMAYSVNKTQAQQRCRIQQGVRSGELSRQEARNLAAGQRRIAQYEHRSRMDGRGLSQRERRNLAQMQQRQNAAIYRNKND